jgi:DNA-binding response OmpR family regulator
MKKRNILIVDDNESLLSELENVLNAHGFKVSSISNSEFAVEAARKIIPDVILVDIKMGKLSGFQMADRLNRIDETAHIPVIAMTGVFTREKDIELMNICGIKKCLIKPFSPEEMLSAVDSA